MSDIGLMIIMSIVNELVCSIILVLMFFIFLIDSFIIQPYSNLINSKYISATSFMFFVSLIKLVSFEID